MVMVDGEPVVVLVMATLMASSTHLHVRIHIHVSPQDPYPQIPSPIRIPRIEAQMNGAVRCQRPIGCVVRHVKTVDVGLANRA
jgi:hypothetical protein